MTCGHDLKWHALSASLQRAEEVNHIELRTAMAPTASKRKGSADPNVRRTRNRRMRVCFEVDQQVDAAVRKGRIHEIDRRSPEEARDCWVSRKEIGANIRLMPRAIESYRFMNPEFGVYECSVRTTYVLCAFAAESNGLPEGISAEHLILLGAEFLRGLEAHAVPGVGRDRAQNRLDRIQTVVQLHQQLKLQGRPPAEVEAVLRKVAQDFSKTPRMFARVLASADELAVAADRISVRYDAMNPSVSRRVIRESKEDVGREPKQDVSQLGCALPVA